MEHPVIAEDDETIGTPSTVASASSHSYCTSDQVSSRKQQTPLAGTGTTGDLFTSSPPSDWDLSTAELPKIETSWTRM